jgi:2-keto-4-pentenoate hydratase
VSEIDARLAAALRAQLANRRAALAAGATHVGWKLGMGERESIGGEIALGHLTSATCLESGSTYAAGRAAADLRADAELAVELGRDLDPEESPASARAAIAAYAAAVEICDLAALPGEPEAAVATNVFHRAVAFGPWRETIPPGALEAALVVDGVERAKDRVGDDLAPRLLACARLLAAVGERLAAGDRVITGSVVQVPVEAGGAVEADLGPLGSARLTIVS